MSQYRLIQTDELKSKVHFTDLIDPMAEAFRVSSRGLAQSGLIVFFPGETVEAGDIYVKTGASAGRPLCVIKIAPWFGLNQSNGQPQGGFWAVLDAQSGHTKALIQDEHHLSDIRTAASGALMARLFAPPVVDTVAVLGAGTQAFWQVLAFYRERPFRKLFVWARNETKALALRERLLTHLPDVLFTCNPAPNRLSGSVTALSRRRRRLIR